jgi:hypothetical protein
MSGILERIVRRRRASASSRLGPPPESELPSALAPTHVNGTAPANGGPPAYATPPLNGAALHAAVPEEGELTSEAQAVEEPATEPAPDATEEPATEPAPDATEEPATEPAPDATEEPATEHAPDATEEPATEPAPDATEEPATEPAPELEQQPELQEEPDEPRAPHPEPDVPAPIADAPIAAAPAPAVDPPPPAEHLPAPAAPRASFAERGRIRRRARYLRRLREVQLRDLGGFIVELRRFDRERPELVEGKVQSALETDAELRALERALGSEQPLRELREPGIGGVCSQCGAVHGSGDRYCASCGEPLSGIRDLDAPE